MATTFGDNEFLSYFTRIARNDISELWKTINIKLQIDN